MERSSSRSGSRSRKSYPLLNQISLTPLSPRYPIDDDNDNNDDDNTGASHGNNDSRHSYYDGNDDQSQGYFSARSTSPERVYSGASTPRTRTPPSYLTSFSVPGTPGPLSHSHSESRSASRTRARRDRRSKSSSRTGSNLSSYDAESGSSDSRRRTPGPGPGPGPGTPGHSHQRSSNSTGAGRHGRRHGHAKSDSGWMLRTGIALAESTREEKGQSWLVKRQSSTSLASDAKNNSSSSGAMTRTPSRPRSSKSRRPSSSGMSTPRWGPRSYAPSRKGSRPDLTMTTTGLEMTPSNNIRTATPPSSGGDDQSRGFRPDMVDARIRAEVALMQQQQQDGDGTWWQGDREIGDDDFDNDDDDDDYYDDYDRWSFDSDSAEEIDEREMYRLTRERGFGLGSWLDRMVEWTLFGVDEWPSLSMSAAPPTATTNTTTTNAGAADAGAVSADDAVDISQDGDGDQQARTTASSGDDDDTGLIGDTDGDGNSLSDRDDKSSVVVVDKSGETGGWEDARWLFHAVRRALF